MSFKKFIKDLTKRPQSVNTDRESAYYRQAKAEAELRMQLNRSLR